MFYVQHTCDGSYWSEGISRRWSGWSRWRAMARPFLTEAAAVSAAERDCYAHSTDLRIVEVIDPAAVSA